MAFVFAGIAIGIAWVVIHVAMGAFKSVDDFEVSVQQALDICQEQTVALCQPVDDAIEITVASFAAELENWG